MTDLLCPGSAGPRRLMKACHFWLAAWLLPTQCPSLSFNSLRRRPSCHFHSFSIHFPSFLCLKVKYFYFRRSVACFAGASWAEKDCVRFRCHRGGRTTVGGVDLKVFHCLERPSLSLGRSDPRDENGIEACALVRAACWRAGGGNLRSTSS